MDETPTFLTGRLLLAMPGMGDPRFREAVILIALHDEDGALGIGIGHERGDLGLADLLGQLDIEGGDPPSGPVFHGGPVDTNRGFVLHSTDWGGQDTVGIAGLCALTATQDVLRAIGEGRGPSDYLVALGYAGWTGGQLEEEMTRHGWFIVDASHELLFETDSDDRWNAAYRSAGIDPALLGPDSGSA
ncbi:YqgE/AlgH family protein [Sphingomicrobium sp. XHP0239]|uniref:YqgE/AlgH family protein n=1 Tax=Sphingomicrobium maritimum TaxID=3133972 RepID=UPI0031CC8069